MRTPPHPQTVAPSRRRARGLTLMELMVALAIAGILAAIAVPAYLDSVRRARRADAITTLQQVMLLQERHRANSPQYATHLIASGGSIGGVGAATAPGAAGSVDTPGGTYSVSLSGASATGYTVQAQARGSQAPDSPCQVLQLQVSGGQVVQASGATAALGNDAAANRRCWGT
jgi:type IV pilus assembly protein PilE